MDGRVGLEKVSIPAKWSYMNKGPESKGRLMLSRNYRKATVAKVDGPRDQVVWNKAVKDRKAIIKIFVFGLRAMRSLILQLFTMLLGRILMNVN